MSEPEITMRSHQDSCQRILQALYDSEINATISWFWDGGFDVELGDELNGIVAKTTTHTIEQAVDFLRTEALKAYPLSTFTRTHGASFEDAPDAD